MFYWKMDMQYMENSINQEIYTLEKRLQKSRNLEEKRYIIERILSLKNSKNREG